MQINSSVIQAAASSQLGRLELRNIDGDQTCVCNKSFSGWVVHVFRYKFSKNYRAQEQETRRQILAAALGNGNEEFTLSEVQQDSVLDRRRFNRYIDTELKKLASSGTTGHEGPDVIHPSTSAQNTQAEKTLSQATSEEPESVQEPSATPSDTSVQTSQTAETLAQATNVVSKPDQPSATSAKSSGDSHVPPETRKKTQRPNLSRPTASSQSKTVQKKASNEPFKPKTVQKKASNEPFKSKTVQKKTSNEPFKSRAMPKKVSSDAGGKLQPTSERKPIQGRTRQTSSTEKAKPQKATSNRTKTSAPISTTGKTAADSRPVTTETITVNYEDTMSNSDNQTWIRKRDLWARDHLTEDHVAAVFYVGGDSGEIPHNIAISEIRRECVPTVATLEKRIGERLEQYNPDANANTKHFLTYLTLRNDRVPEERGRLFETEDMKKSSPTAIWRDSFSAGGILGIPPNVTECGRRLPTETLMFCANKIISKLPVETKTGVFRGDEGGEAYSLVAEMYESSADPEYRKEFSPNGQELAEKDFEWLLEYVASFGSFCNQ